MSSKKNVFPWTEREVKALIQAVKIRHSLLFGSSCMLIGRLAREGIWSEIAQCVNENSDTLRTSSEVRLKYNEISRKPEVMEEKSLVLSNPKTKSQTKDLKKLDAGSKAWSGATVETPKSSCQNNGNGSQFESFNPQTTRAIHYQLVGENHTSFYSEFHPGMMPISCSDIQDSDRVEASPSDMEMDRILPQLASINAPEKRIDITKQKRRLTSQSLRKTKLFKEGEDNLQNSKGLNCGNKLTGTSSLSKESHQPDQEVSNSSKTTLDALTSIEHFLEGISETKSVLERIADTLEERNRIKKEKLKILESQLTPP